jgi:hypothetical protein
MRSLLQMDVSRISLRSQFHRWGAACLLGAAPLLRAAETCATGRPLRPFYVIGHGANTLPQAADYLSAGANALEVDVNVRAGPSDALCIGHGPDVGIGAASKTHSIPIADYLVGLHQLARTNSLALVYFDCKTLAATPEHGAALLQDIRKYLAGPEADHVEVTVLISVGKLKEKAIFADITRGLGSREGLMVDGFSDPAAVTGYFTGEQVTNQAFCDGIVPMNPVLSQFLIFHSVHKACALRNREHHIRFVGTWSVNNPWCMRQYIKMGVDGIVVDRGPVWYNFCLANWGHGLRSLTKIVRTRGARLGIRLATPADNPFAASPPANP